MADNPKGRQTMARVSAAIADCLKIPFAFFYFFKQRSAISSHPEILRKPDAAHPDEWISPLPYALISAVIVLLVVEGILFAFSHSTLSSHLGRAMEIAEIEVKIEAIDNQADKLEESQNQTLDSASPAASASIRAQLFSQTPGAANAPDAKSQTDAAEDVSKELDSLDVERAALERSVQKIVWQGYFYTAWETAALPVTMIVAAFAVRRKIALLAKIDRSEVSAQYLYLSASYALVPAILSGFFVSLFGVGIDVLNVVAIRTLYIASAIATLWYFYTLYSAGTRLSSILAIVRPSDRRSVSASIVSANFSLFVAWEISYFLLGRIYWSAWRFL